MAVDLLALLTKGLWTQKKGGTTVIDIVTPIAVEVLQEQIDVSVDFIEEE